MISNVYMAVFQVGIDTTFVCFLVDEEINKDPEKMRAHPKLIALFDKNAAKSMEIGAKKSDRHMDKSAREILCGWCIKFLFFFSCRKMNYQNVDEK